METSHFRTWCLFGIRNLDGTDQAPHSVMRDSCTDLCSCYGIQCVPATRCPRFTISSYEPLWVDSLNIISNLESIVAERHTACTLVNLTLARHLVTNNGYSLGRPDFVLMTSWFNDSLITHMALISRSCPGDLLERGRWRILSFSMQV